MNNSLEVVFDKKNNKIKKAIKDKKTRKKVVKLFLNKRKPHQITRKKKKNVKLSLVKGGADKYLNSNVKEIKKKNDIIEKNFKDFNNYLNLYLKTQENIENVYIKNTTSFLNTFISNLEKDSLIKNKKLDDNANETKRNIDRLFILNYIYNFSLRDYKSGRLNQIMGSDTNMLFYFKKRKLQSYRKELVQKSYIKGYYKNSPKTLWYEFSVLREYEFKMEKAFSVFSETIKNVKNNIKDVDDYISERIGDDTKKVESKTPITLEFDNEKKRYDDFKAKSFEAITKYNENLDKKSPAIHYYIKDISLKNINLLLLNDFDKLFKTSYFNILRGLTKRKDNLLKKKKETPEYKKYVQSNNLVFKLGNEMLKIFYEKVKEVQNQDYIEYYKNFDTLHYLTLKFHEINTLLIFRPNIMPYFDIGQPSMLTYETYLYNNPKNVLTKRYTNKNINIDNINDVIDNLKNNKFIDPIDKRYITRGEGDTSSIKKKLPLSIYIAHSNYYNNILTLPNYFTNHLKLFFLKQNEDDNYNKHIKTIVKENKLNRDSKYFEQGLSTENMKLDSFNFNLAKVNIYEEGSVNFKEVDTINSKKKSLNNDDNSVSSGTSNNFFLPLSSFYAMFSINDMNKAMSLSDFTRDSGMSKIDTYGLIKSMDSFREKIGSITNYKKNNLLNITKDDIFHINSADHVVLGTFQFLYKRISFLTHFLLNNETTPDSPNFISLVDTFFDDTFFEKLKAVSNIEKEDIGKTTKKIKKHIQNNIGIYNGINSKKNYYMYIMLVYSEHLLKLIEYVNELEYLTEKIDYYSFKYEKDGKPRIENDYMKKYKEIKELIKAAKPEEDADTKLMIKNINKIRNRLEEIKKDGDDEYKSLLSEISDKDKLFTESEFIEEIDTKNYKEKYNPIDVPKSFQRFNYYINLIFYDGKKTTKDINEKIEKLKKDKKDRGQTNITLSFKDFLKKEGLELDDIENTNETSELSEDGLYLNNEEFNKEFFDEYVKEKFKSNILIQKILNSKDLPNPPNIDNFLQILEDNYNLELSSFEEELLFHFLRNNVGKLTTGNIDLSKEDKEAAKVKDEAELSTKLGKKFIKTKIGKMIVRKIATKQFKKIKKNSALLENAFPNLINFDTIKKKKQLILDKKILFNNVAFFKPSYLEKIQSYLKSLDTKYKTYLTSINKFKNKVKSTNDLLDTVITKNNENIKAFQDKVSKNKYLYIIKKDNNIEVEFTKKEDVDYEEQVSNNMDKELKDVPDKECFKKYELREDINLLIEDLDDYILYNPEFYGEYSQLNKKIKSSVEAFNSEMILVSLFTDIMENKLNISSGKDGDGDSNGEGDATIDNSVLYIPYQYLLFNNKTAINIVKENTYDINKNYNKKSEEAKPYNKYVFEYKEHKYFNDVINPGSKNKKDTSEKSFEYYEPKDQTINLGTFSKKMEIKARITNFKELKDNKKTNDKGVEEKNKIDRILKSKTTKIPKYLKLITRDKFNFDKDTTFSILKKKS